MIVAFTGHRPDRLGGWDPLHPTVLRVRRALRAYLIKAWPHYIISGMAQGVDQWAAEEAHQLGIPFIAAQPCDDMELAWPMPSQERFHALRERACNAIVVSPGPFKPWKLQRRNEWMVDNSDLLVAVHDGGPGGTANCVAYAEAAGRPVRRLTWTDVALQ